MQFLMTTIMLMEIYLIVSLALNLLLGVAGRFSAYEAAIMGVGAYVAALLAQNLGVDLLVGCIVGAIFCVLQLIESLLPPLLESFAGDFDLRSLHLFAKPSV